jgi:hypothetical protein
MAAMGLFGVLLAAGIIVCCPCQGQTPPTFTSGADGAAGAPAAAGSNGNPQPTPQSDTLVISGTYPDFSCGRGGHGGRGGNGIPEQQVNGGKGGDGKDGAIITIYIGANNITLQGVEKPNGGNGGHGGNGAAPEGKGGAGGAGGAKGDTVFNPHTGISGFSHGLITGGVNGVPGTPGVDAP